MDNVRSIELTASDLEELARLRVRVVELERAQQVAATYAEQLHFQANMLAQVSDAIVAINNERKIIYWNEGATRLYGLVAEEVLGRSLDYAYTTRWPTPEAQQASFDAIDKTGFWRDEVSQVRRDGTDIFTDVTVSVLRDTEGKSSGLLAILRDVTARKAVEETIQFLSEVSILLSTSLNYELTLQSLARMTIPMLGEGCAIFLIEDGRTRLLTVAHINPTKELLATNILKQFQPRPGDNTFTQKSLELMQPVIQNDLVKSGWLDSVSNPKITRLWQRLGAGSLMVVPLVSQEQPFGVLACTSTKPNFYLKRHLVVAQELGRRVALAIENAQLYHQTQQALEAQQALDSLKDQFLSIASHELRTPLAAVKGYVQMLQRQHARHDPSPEHLRESRMLGNMEQQLNRMNNLISEMLDVSRIQNGKLELHYIQNVNLNELVERLIEQHQDQAAITEHIISLQTSQPTLIATVDEDRVEQVLNNLLSNALKYSPPGRPVVVGLEANEAENTVVIWVRDQGFGINPDQQHRIFERYYRAGLTADINVDGLGLGLFISQEIVTRHNGRIWLESLVGHGSTFYFSLPLQPPAGTFIFNS